MDTKSAELPTGVELQYVEQGDPAGVPMLLTSRPKRASRSRRQGQRRPR